MKTFTFTIAFLALQILFNINATALELKNQAYLDTTASAAETMMAEAVYNFALAQEFSLEEEEYVDDIPFNTESICKQLCYKTAIKQDFSLPEENYIDDIPFDTAKVVANKLSQDNLTSLGLLLEN